MNKVNNTTIIIASAFRADATEVENAHNSMMASQLIAPHILAPLQTCVGSWKEEGQESASVELSMVMPVQSGKDLDAVLAVFLQSYKQDAVLAVNPSDFSAHIINARGESTHIGTFQVITEEEAKGSECYTYWNKQYWVAK